METSNILPILIFSLFVFVIPAFLFVEFVKLLFRDTFILRKEKSLKKYYRLFPQRIDKRIHELLLSKFPYYSNLATADRVKFYVRLNLFLASKKFKPCELNEVTQEMKVLISASAIQLTFGLEKFIFHHFKTILVYPKAYLSHFDNNYHKGDVNIKGTIAFSFEDFIDGYGNPSDSINLGLHEMAHALELEFNLKDEYDTFFAAYYERWLKSAVTELVRMNYGQSDFLRKYASRNVKEFFSVCVENFFERPTQMKERLPEIYKHLSLLLNQDTASGNSPNQSRAKFERSPSIPDGQILFQSSISFSKTITSIIILAFFLLLIGLFIKEAALAIILSIVWLAVSGFSIINLKDFYIYPGVLVVKPILKYFFKHKTYNLENIVSVSFFEDNKKMIKISHVYYGKVVYDKYTIFFNDEKVREMISKLKSFKVMVRQK